MAAFAALAQNSPQTLTNMIAWNSSTTNNPLDVNVTFADGHVEIVDISLTRGIDQARLSGDFAATGSEVWVQIMEQAVIQKIGQGVPGVCSGNAASIWEDLTGVEPVQHSTNGQANAWSEARIRDAINSGKAVMVGTTLDPPKLTKNHQYSIVGIDDEHNELVLFDPALGDVLGTSLTDGARPGLKLNEITANVSLIVVGGF